jgi:hypothetical protein
VKEQQQTRFWTISSPKYKSDYKHSYINGDLDYPFGLPGIKCDVCGATWGGRRVLPYECPERLRSKKNLTERWPIARHEHTVLQQQVLAAISTEGVPFVDLRPGDTFKPCYLEVPSLPRADFLWSRGGVLVVSEPIKRLFLDMCGDDIDVCAITLCKIGKREAKLPPPMPRTGEPEDLINEVPLLSDMSSIGPYFQVVPRFESEYPRDHLPKGTCLGCRRVETEIIYPWESAGRFRMTNDIWKGQSVFYLGAR